MTLSLMLVFLLQAAIYLGVAIYPAVEVLLVTREYLTRNIYTYRNRRTIAATSTLSILLAGIVLVYFTQPAAMYFITSLPF